MMYTTIKTLIDILRLRGGPQDLPTSAGLLAVFVLTLIGLQGLLGQTLIPDDPTLFPQAALSALVTLGWLNLLLRLFGKGERFLQTATAIFGIAALLTPISIPLVAAVRPQADGTMALSPLSLVAFALSIYLIYINARILREAIERPMFQCVLLFLAGEILIFSLVLATGIGLPPS
jgi:hypothetical protein